MIYLQDFEGKTDKEDLEGLIAYASSPKHDITPSQITYFVDELKRAEIPDRLILYFLHNAPKQQNAASEYFLPNLTREDKDNTIWNELTIEEKTVLACSYIAYNGAKDMQSVTSGPLQEAYFDKVLDNLKKQSELHNMIKKEHLVYLAGSKAAAEYGIVGAGVIYFLLEGYLQDKKLAAIVAGSDFMGNSPGRFKVFKEIHELLTKPVSQGGYEIDKDDAALLCISHGFEKYVDGHGEIFKDRVIDNYGRLREILYSSPVAVQLAGSCNAMDTKGADTLEKATAAYDNFYIKYFQKK